MKPTVISLFSGCGGSSLGYKWAGFKELLAIDFDKLAVETFKMNFPEVPCWQKDIKKVSGKEILDFCKIKKGELSLLDASPPCQGFSISGKHRVLDSRNDLFRDFIRLIKELDPMVFVMENVSGLIKGKMKGLFIEIMNELKSLPYQVKCKLMNAMYYEVPQSRERLIWTGIRKDLNKNYLFEAQRHFEIITTKQALKGLPVDNSRTLNDLGLKIWEKLRCGSFAKYHPKKHWFNSQKLNPNKPSSTITAKMMKRGHAGLYHWKYPRALNINELKRLATFPDDFQFIGRYEQQWAGIGNAVMPKFMEAIALNIKEQIFKQIET